MDVTGQYVPHAQVGPAPGRPPLKDIKIMPDDPEALLKIADEIKAKYAANLQGLDEPPSELKSREWAEETHDRRSHAIRCRASSGALRLDLSGPVLALFASLLVILVVLPIAWIAIFAFSTKDGAATIANFGVIFGAPEFQEPLVTTLMIATSVGIICCLVAAPMGWLVARSDMPGRRLVRTLVTASFVTPPFLGAIAWELLAAPNSGLLDQAWRAVTGAPQDEALFNIYSLGGVIFVISCYTFPYVFVLVANALDRIPGELEDASSMLGARSWQTARSITIPMALPAILAGVLVAFLQAMNLFGSPAILAIPAGFHTMTTKIWSLFQFPPKPELAAAAALPLLVLTVVLLRAQSAILGRRSYAVLGGKYGAPRPVPLGAFRWLALALCIGLLMLPVFLPYGALLNAAFSKIPTKLLTWSNLSLHNVHFAFFELSQTWSVMRNTFLLAVLSGTLERCWRSSSPISWRDRPCAGIACSVSWRRLRSPSPASCWALACSWPTRGPGSASPASIFRR